LANIYQLLSFILTDETKKSNKKAPRRDAETADKVPNVILSASEESEKLLKHYRFFISLRSFRMTKRSYLDSLKRRTATTLFHSSIQ
jgi:hypothetical protein